MGDLRNKIAKIERAKAEKAAMEAFLRAGGWRPPARSRPHAYHHVKCACGLNCYEAKLYQCDREGIFCLVCMPLKFKREILGHMVNCGLNFDAADHGEE